MYPEFNTDVAHVVTVQCQSSDVSLTLTAGVFVVLSVDVVFIAFSITLLKEKEKNLNSGALYSFENRNSDFFFQYTLERLYLAVISSWMAERTL